MRKTICVLCGAPCLVHLFSSLILTLGFLGIARFFLKQLSYIPAKWLPNYLWPFKLCLLHLYSLVVYGSISIMIHDSLYYLLYQVLYHTMIWSTCLQNWQANHVFHSGIPYTFSAHDPKICCYNVRTNPFLFLSMATHLSVGLL